MINKPAVPRCPYCNTSGLDKLAMAKKVTFMVVFCGVCGAIFGVVPVFETVSAPPSPPPMPKDETEPKKEDKPHLTKDNIGAMLAAGSGGMYHNVFRGNDDSKA